MNACGRSSGSSNSETPPVVNPAALEKNPLANASTGASPGACETYRYGTVPNRTSVNRLRKTSMDDCCMLSMGAFSPYELRKNPVTSSRTVVR